MWGVYGDSHHSVEIRAFMAGLAYLGRPFRERNHNGFNLRNQVEEFSPVAVTGLRPPADAVRDAYNAIGVQCVIVDYGYIARASRPENFGTGHWLCGVNRLGWVPAFECPPDRFERLGVRLIDRRKRGDRIYICGQHFGDPSHGMCRENILAWAFDTARWIHGLTDRPVVWRPHPESPVSIGGLENSTGPIDWDDVYCVVTLNSNIGHEALINGVPVVNQMRAPYEELANDALTDDLFMPDIDCRLRYFSRAAYAQWTLDEMRIGEPHLWLSRNGLLERKEPK